jgi:hypothetical protein
MGWSREADVVREPWMQASESSECVRRGWGEAAALEEFRGSGKMTRRDKTGDTCE